MPPAYFQLSFFGTVLDVLFDVLFASLTSSFMTYNKRKKNWYLAAKLKWGI